MGCHGMADPDNEAGPGESAGHLPPLLPGHCPVWTLCADVASPRPGRCVPNGGSLEPGRNAI